MKRISLIISLALANAGVFMVISAFLPRRDVYSFSSVIEQYRNSRAHWDIPCAVLVGTVLLSLAIYIWLESNGKLRAIEVGRVASAELPAATASAEG